MSGCVNVCLHTHSHLCACVNVCICTESTSCLHTYVSVYILTPMYAPLVLVSEDPSPIHLHTKARGHFST